MKYLITESQYKLLTEEKILKLDFDVFNNDWNLLQRFLDKKGNPPYKIIGDLDLGYTKIESLGNLQSVGGNLNLGYNKTIKSLGNLKSVGGYLDLRYTNITSLGNLESVGGGLNLYYTLIESLGNIKSVGGWLDLSGSNIKSLGNLESVGDSLNLRDTPLSKTTTKEEIRNIPNLTIGGNIYI